MLIIRNDDCELGRHFTSGEEKLGGRELDEDTRVPFLTEY